MGTQELENTRQATISPKAARDTNHLNLLSLHKTPKNAVIDCYVSSPSVEKLKENFLIAHSMYVTGEPTTSGCAFDYSFLYSSDLGTQFQTSASAAGLKEAVAKLHQRESSAKREIEKNYGVVFGAQGDAIRRTLTVKNREIVLGPQLIAKNPSLPRGRTETLVTRCAAQAR
jgi:hypothetical protein